MDRSKSFHILLFSLAALITISLFRDWELIGIMQFSLPCSSLLDQNKLTAYFTIDQGNMKLSLPGKKVNINHLNYLNAIIICIPATGRGQILCK